MADELLLELIREGQKNLHGRIDAVERKVDEAARETHQVREAVEQYAQGTLSRLTVLENRQNGIGPSKAPEPASTDAQALDLGRTLLGIPKLLKAVQRNVVAILVFVLLIFTAWREFRSGRTSAPPLSLLAPLSAEASVRPPAGPGR